MEGSALVQSQDEAVGALDGGGRIAADAAVGLGLALYSVGCVLDLLDGLFGGLHGLVGELVCHVGDGKGWV